MNTKQSQTVCLTPIAKCLKVLEDEVRSVGDWIPHNKEQNRFLSGYYAQAGTETAKMPEIEAIASADAEVLNEFLRKRGFNIRLQPFSDYPPHIGAASVFKLLLEWVQPGRVTSIRDGAYPAVAISKFTKFHSSRHARASIASVCAKNGDLVYMTAFENPPNGFGLADMIEKISHSLESNYEFDRVIFPMISYDEEIDISWLKEMETQGEDGPWFIDQAVQQTKFRMNEIGAKVESAVGMGMRLGALASEPKPPLIIDRPFLLWISRPGMTHPLFIGHFTEDSWKKPDSL